MSDVGFIHIEPGEIPKCECGSQSWLLKQRIERESDLVRVDQTGDLVFAKPDPNLYSQSILLECKDCGRPVQPRAGMSSKEEWDEKGRPEPYLEAYSEGRQVLAVNEGGDLVAIEEEITGIEDCYGWPDLVRHNQDVESID